MAPVSWAPSTETGSRRLRVDELDADRGGAPDRQLRPPLARLAGDGRRRPAGRAPRAGRPQHELPKKPAAPPRLTVTMYVDARRRSGRAGSTRRRWRRGSSSGSQTSENCAWPRSPMKPATRRSSADLGPVAQAVLDDVAGGVRDGAERHAVGADHRGSARRRTGGDASARAGRARSRRRRRGRRPRGSRRHLRRRRAAALRRAHLRRRHRPRKSGAVPRSSAWVVSSSRRSVRFIGHAPRRRSGSGWGRCGAWRAPGSPGSSRCRPSTA